jgi:hypothetical protein
MRQARNKSGSIEVRPEEILLGEALAQLYGLLERCGFDPALYLQKPRVHKRESQSNTAHFLRLKGGSPGELVPAARIFQLWFCEPRFLSDSGAPLPLPLSGDISITSVLEATNCRLDARSVRDTLVEAGLAERRGEFTRPLTRVVLGKGSERAKQVMYSLRDLMATLNFNMNAGDDRRKRFQRFVFDTKVPLARVEEFETFLQTQALEFLFMVEEWMLTAEKQATPGEAMLPMNVHLFSATPDGHAPPSGQTEERAVNIPKRAPKGRGNKASQGHRIAKKAKSRTQAQRMKRNAT